MELKGQATPYLTFNGNAKEALTFYAQAFQAEIQRLQTFGEADYPTPPEAADRVMHARLSKGDFLIMVSDTFPGQDVQIGNHISLALTFESKEEIQSVYEKLQQEGTIQMELQDTFWGSTYAKLQDKFGVIWQLDCPKQ
ncbi:glyoxalase [Bacillus sp. FJAT-27231]|uniref:VOC family protein n=1 Tax=Bacillus sp. FJAT-27231 TaxID=1679168 RepID=UPI0006A1DCFA|nr:glyoxalase [Bacillus sp. FJAT-27231]